MRYGKWGLVSHVEVWLVCCEFKPDPLYVLALSIVGWDLSGTACGRGTNGAVGVVIEAGIVRCTSPTQIVFSSCQRVRHAHGPLECSRVSVARGKVECQGRGLILIVVVCSDGARSPTVGSICRTT